MENEILTMQNKIKITKIGVLGRRGGSYCLYIEKEKIILSNYTKGQNVFLFFNLMVAK